MPKSIVDIPLDEISWADIEALTQQRISENARLEFKKTLSRPNGHRDSESAVSEVPRQARDELANELVAFANAYGGTLVLGIDENRQKPPSAEYITPLKHVHELADKLRASITSVIDPPIYSFDLRAITPPDDDTEGVIVFRVNSSTLAPHGVGTPPEAYVRRGTACAPMTMRDIQSRFWEARTALERIESIRAESRRRLGTFRDRTRTEEQTTTVLFRCAAIPETRINLGSLKPENRWIQSLCPDAGEIGFRHSAADKAGSPGWLPRAHGVFSRSFDERALWNATDDGTVTVEGVSFPHDSSQDPDWYSAPALQTLIMACRLRLRAQQPDIPIQFDMELYLGQDVRRVSRPGRQVPAPLTESKIGPFSLLQRNNLSELFNEIDREIHASFASISFEPIVIHPDELLDEWSHRFR